MFQFFFGLGEGTTLARAFISNHVQSSHFSSQPHRQEEHFGVYLSKSSELFQTTRAMFA